MGEKKRRREEEDQEEEDQEEEDQEEEDQEEEDQEEKSGMQGLRYSAKRVQEAVGLIFQWQQKEGRHLQGLCHVGQRRLLREQAVQAIHAQILPWILPCKEP